MAAREATSETVLPLRRADLDLRDALTRLGGGALGGKAAGLARARGAIAERFDPARYGGLRVEIPRAVVIGADVFESFVDRGGLRELLDGDGPPDDRIAHAFQRADFPVEWVGDLTALAAATRTPIAVRSSGVLEDDADRPFAGVYGTKMTPNHQAEPAERFRRLAEAIKFVWASTGFREARAYARAAGETRAESMAVLLQEVVGRARGERWYPEVSGVARSVNLVPAEGARREDGVVHLALGLGKTVVDGDACWTYSPGRPQAPPPFGGPRDLLEHTQRRFWAVRRTAPREYDPTRETEWLDRPGLDVAEADGSLDRIASTWDVERDRLVPGLSAEGPRAITFAPLLDGRSLPFADLVRDLLHACEDVVGGEVEIEFAATFAAGPDGPGRLALLQSRPLALGVEVVEVAPGDLDRPDVVVASRRAIGNARSDDLVDVVYLDPETFDFARSREAAEAVREINARLVAEGRRYVLIGFGRWGSADPWLGVPVDWSSIAGAAAIVEVERAGRGIDPSQGSHFFHNLTAFRVAWMAVARDARPPVDWAALARAETVEVRGAVRRVRFARPLEIRVDGRSGRATVRTTSHG